MGVVLVGVLAAGCAAKPFASNGDAGFVSGDGTIAVLPEADRRLAPSVQGVTLDGRRFDLASLRGRIVVLNVWGSWCGPCRAEAPLLQRAYPRLTRKGADLVGLDTRESAEPARAFVQAAGLTYPSVSDRDGRLQLAFSDTLPPAAIPSTVIVDAQGRVAARIIGPVDSVTTLLDVVDQVRGVDPSPTASSRPSQSPSGQS